MSTEQEMTFYLLAIRGKLKPATLEAARAIHNSTAGAPANVAAARSLGDVSHMVYVPAEQTGPEAGEFLILDIWNNMDGLNTFFANHQVQEQAGLIFTERDPIVCMPATGFLTYHIPAPYGRNERIVATVRGTVHAPDEARTAHNNFAGAQVNNARLAGNLSHEPYFRMAPLDSGAAAEFFAVDVWMDGEGMGKHYAQPAFAGGLQKVFSGAPAFAVWRHPAGEWVEW